MGRRGPRNLIAAGVAGAALGSVALVLSVVVLAEQAFSLNVTRAAAAEQTDTGTVAIDRSNKSDLVSVPTAKHARIEIKSVEVVGIRDASIVYRDRDGNVLFRTDPLANVTVVTKNVDLPEVTIRESAGTEVDRLPLDESSPHAAPHGCESSFARPSPTALTRIPSRCVTRIESSTSLAALH